MSKEEQNNTITFNYFLHMFENEVLKRTKEICLKKETYLEEDDIIYVAEVLLTNEEKIRIYNESFYEILVNYLSLSENKELTIVPSNPITLCCLILNSLEDNKYKESFLLSVQFIIKRYLSLLDKGDPTLSSRDTKDKEKLFTITYDSNSRMNDFESNNMSLEEQDETMLKILKLSLEGKDINLPDIKIINRKDI
ncbi:MAG: hypothetical protein ACI31M_03025 [Bacilli bacterium]